MSLKPIVRVGVIVVIVVIVFIFIVKMLKQILPFNAWTLEIWYCDSGGFRYYS